MKNRVVKQHHINVDHMRKNTEYFGEALAMCEKFGLLPLMEFTQNWDEELVQFYTTVFFTENEQKTIKWLTNGQLLEATWSKFGEALGYPILDNFVDADANVWRCHDSEFASNKETMAHLYIRGYGVPGKTPNIDPCVPHSPLHLPREPGSQGWQI
jgi:hypothetical protein